VERGLVDGLGTLRGVVSKRFPDAHVVTAEPRRPLLARLGIGPGSGGLAGRLGSPVDHLMAGLEAVERRAIWSRFGL
jgi:hypothetical protein